MPTWNGTSGNDTWNDDIYDTGQLNGDDIINGLGGHDTIYTYGGDDTLNGGDGDDN